MLERRSGGGCMTLFGLPFLLIGLLLIALGIIPDMGGEESLGILLLGSAFTAAGGWLVFWRGRIIVNRREGVLRMWWGFPVRVRVKEHRLDMVERVRLVRKERIDPSPRYKYLVQLDGQGLSDPIEMDWTWGYKTGYEKARQVAEMLAEFLKMPLEEPSNDEGTGRDLQD